MLFDRIEEGMKSTTRLSVMVFKGLTLLSISYFVYKESGLFTMLALALIFINTELILINSELSLTRLKNIIHKLRVQS